MTNFKIRTGPRHCADAAAGSGSNSIIQEAIAKAAPLWCSYDPFPLTPALSLREREHRRRRIRKRAPLGVVPTRSLVLPLPEGEGRGEGERALEIADRGSFAIGSQVSSFLRDWLGINGPLLFVIGLSLGHLLFPGSLLAFTNSKPNDIPPLRPPRKEMPPTYWEQHGALIIVSGVVLLGLICAGIWFARRARPQVLVPPEVQARAALESIRGQPETGAVLSAVSQSLRHYVTAAFNLPPEELTTTEFCELITRNESIGPQLATDISEFLRRGDQRKFALSADLQPLEAVPQAFRIIEMGEARRAELRHAQQNSEAA